MGSCPKPRFLALAVWFLFLPAMLQAFPGGSNRVYTIDLAGSGTPARVEWYVTAPNLGGWEITVSWDAAQCRIYCQYRRILIDRVGRIACAHVGLVERSAFENEIRALLGH